MYEPVYRKQLFDGAMEVTVYGTSRNWSLAGDSAHEMEEKNPGIRDAIADVIDTHGIKRALSPRPTFNAQIVTSDDLTDQRLPRLFRGADADGVLLDRPGDAYLLASADCPTVALYSRHYGAVGLHCGRDCLVDRRAIDGIEPRQYESVFKHSFLGFEEGRAETFRAFIAAGIGPDSFQHLTTETMLDEGQVVPNPYCATNRKLIDYLSTRWPHCFSWTDMERPIVGNTLL